MRKFRLSTIAGLFLISTIILSGCGKLGESEAEKIIKDACKVPSSFVKHDYQVDEKNGLAYLDFSAKNGFGADIRDRAYFVIRDKQIIPVDTDGIDARVLKELAEASPKNFRENIIYCKDLNKYQREMKVYVEVMNRTWDRLGGSDNYFIWKHAKDESRQVNRVIKRYYDRYYEAPSVVQIHYDLPPAFYKVILNGSYMGHWSARGERPTEYPD